MKLVRLLVYVSSLFCALHLGAQPEAAPAAPAATPPAQTASDAQAATNTQAAAAIASGKAHACFARQYVRFSLGRLDQPGDACLTLPVQGALQRGESLASALKAIAFAPAFRQRGFGD